MEPTLDEQLRQLSINLDNFALRYNMNGRNTAETNTDSLQRIEEGETPSHILMPLPEKFRKKKDDSRHILGSKMTGNTVWPMMNGIPLANVATKPNPAGCIERRLQSLIN